MVAGSDGRQLLTWSGFDLPFREDLLVPAIPFFGANDFGTSPTLRLGRSASHVLVGASATGAWRSRSTPRAATRRSSRFFRSSRALQDSCSRTWMYFKPSRCSKAGPLEGTSNRPSSSISVIDRGSLFLPRALRAISAAGFRRLEVHRRHDANGDRSTTLVASAESRSTRSACGFDREHAVVSRRPQVIPRGMPDGAGVRGTHRRLADEEVAVDNGRPITPFPGRRTSA